MCDEREPLLAYLYDEADSAERQRVEAHLATCERCREELDGLRSVRSDLLAWDVPEHESVWKPFTPARPTWSWRDVPAWSLAAAALVMLALGAAGGLGASAWVAGRQTARPTVIASAPLLTPTPVNATQSVSPAEMAAFEQRVLALAARPPAPAGLTSAEYDKQMNIFMDYQRALSILTARVKTLEATVMTLSQNSSQQGGEK
jgi:anti-sigma factor RsiW